ncbi:hypothetical protein AMJ48_00395 [Parcubacteria bacterium DG_74_1]|nr:MAG: hypothetical protein AMJ48_00395 [Parcubacteria bacterium DG_74_1]
MINLLPSEQKEELEQEKNFKLVLALGIVILAFLVSLILILFSIKTSLLVDLDAQEIYIKQKQKELENPEMQELEAKIKENNSILSKLEVFYQGQPDLTLTLEKIYWTLPEEIYLTNLNFNPQVSQVSLDGFSPTRETLVQFKENLERTEGFKEIKFPPASWVYLTDIKFSVNFKIEQPQR